MLKFYYLELSNIIVPGGCFLYLQDQYCAHNILNWKHLLKSNFQRPYRSSLILTVLMVLVCSGDLIVALSVAVLLLCFGLGCVRCIVELE